VTGYAVGLPHHRGRDGVIWYGGGKLAADLTLPKLRGRWDLRPRSTGPSARTAPHRPATYPGGPAPLVMATTQASSAAEGRRDTPGIARCRKFPTVKSRSNDLDPGYRIR
jgi:hypothetical protein